ncbi:hypothetical protein, partial [Actinomadura sp. CNU-125]|uniref:hypothetical protein n=1 Tax=Actinomadura sp. CNU-125 TaxID=1904961 RepID=UPI0021CCB077
RRARRCSSRTRWRSPRFAAVWFLGRDSGTEPAAAAPAAPSTTVPATGASPSPVGEIEFSVRGDGEVESLTYTVNGESTTVENVELPWRASVPVPVTVPRTVYELEVNNGGSGTLHLQAGVEGYPGAAGTVGGVGTARVGGSL